ncbi:MAG: hypothetical protein BA874_02540 [Desulfuromonadales bacterium C00003068]|nr:MAG: hypothetical protein BA874_02540 [Desulfuromonadales bacterium C00003068]
MNAMKYTILALFVTVMFAIVPSVQAYPFVSINVDAPYQYDEGDAEKFIKQIKSQNPLAQRDAAKRIIRSQTFGPEVMDVVDEYLLKGFKIRGNNRDHVDAMAWMIKALGATNDAKYSPTLEIIVKEGSRKLRGYAKKSLAQMY